MKEFKSFDEIQSLTGYVEKVDKGQHQFEQPLGFYRLEKPVHHCALRSCNRLHGFGYVVKTRSGAVVAVGNVCGPKLFGDAFKTMIHAVSSVVARAQGIDSFNIRLAQVPQIVERAQNLEADARELNWAVVSLEQLCPKRILQDLQRRVENRQTIIERQRARTKDDPPAFPGENPRFITDQLGVLKGITALQAPTAIWIVKEDLLNQAALYSDAAGEQLLDDHSKGRRFTKWFAAVESRFDAVQRRLTAAPAFFNDENLHSLALLAKNQAERLAASRLTWNSRTRRVEMKSS